MDKKKNQYLGEFGKYVSCNVLGMLGLSCYILADTFFISKGLGPDGLAALNIAIPVYSFINGCGLMLGVGGATKYSIYGGRQDKAAGTAFFHAAILGLCFAAMFFALGLFFSGPLTKILGADTIIFFMSKIYLQVLLLFTPLFIINNIMICFTRNFGAPKTAMAAMVGGSLSNVLLDYIFIFPLDMGIFGAVLATGLAPLISILLLLPCFIKNREQLILKKVPFSMDLARGILSCGLPSLVTEASSGIVIIAFNKIILGLQGNIGVAAYGVIANLSLVAIAVYTGIAQGIQPLLSRYQGQGNGQNRKPIKKTMGYAFALVLALSGVIYTAVFFYGDGIVKVFNSENNPLLQQIATDGMKLYFIGGAFAGMNIVLSSYFTSVDHPIPAQIIALLRGMIIMLPAVFLLSGFLGLTGVWLAFPLTELLVLGAGVWLADGKKDQINFNIAGMK